MMQTLTATAAIAATWNECEHDVVARINSYNLWTNPLNDAGRFVTKHHGSHRDAPLSTHDVIVRAAKTDCRDADKQLSRSRLGRVVAVPCQAHRGRLSRMARPANLDCREISAL
jgi:hypothetical protein